MLKALIFDVDGTMADTEQHGHLPACNEAFATLGFSIQWSWEEFKAMLPISGNAQRMKLALTQKGTLPTAEIDAAVQRLTALKKKLYIEKYVKSLPLRAGVAELIQEAVQRGIRLAIVSTTHEEQIHALLRQHLSWATEHFVPILGKDSGIKTAPESPLYTRCLAELGTSVAETLVIEDSDVGLQAARRAGLRCAVIYNDYTFGEGFAGAVLVAPSLKHINIDWLDTLRLVHSFESEPILNKYGGLITK
jgi:HAD superfamily hydrolase (TIGR01509 family)